VKRAMSGALGVLLLAPAVIRTAEPRVLFVCGASLAIGMPQRAALAATERICKAEPMGDTAYFLLTNKVGRQSEGYVEFSGGLLSEVAREWTSDVDADAASGFYGAAKALESEGRTACVIATRSNSAPTVEWRDVILRCGAKQLQISVISPRNGKRTATVQEILH
jgi:hypothetical protein